MFDFSLNQVQEEPEEDNNQISDIFNYLLSMVAQQRQQNQGGEQAPNDYFSAMLRGGQQPGFQPQSSQGGGGGFGGGNSLKDLLKQRESGGNYAANNTLGYTGAYQFGAPALETVGFLRKGAGRLGNKGLNDPRNWLIEGGKQSFLANREHQERAMDKLMAHNKERMKKMGLLTEETPSNVINGMLAAAHLAGPGGVKALMKGRNRRDAYGTGAQEYFNLGTKAR